MCSLLASLARSAKPWTVRLSLAPQRRNSASLLPPVCDICEMQLECVTCACVSRTSALLMAGPCIHNTCREGAVHAQTAPPRKHRFGSHVHIVHTKQRIHMSVITSARDPASSSPGSRLPTCGGRDPFGCCTFQVKLSLHQILQREEMLSGATRLVLRKQPALHIATCPALLLVFFGSCVLESKDCCTSRMLGKQHMHLPSHLSKMGNYFACWLLKPSCTFVKVLPNFKHVLRHANHCRLAKAWIRPRAEMPILCTMVWLASPEFRLFPEIAEGQNKQDIKTCRAIARSAERKIPLPVPGFWW